jgi:hypothetical protein
LISDKHSAGSMDFPTPDLETMPLDVRQPLANHLDAADAARAFEDHGRLGDESGERRVTTHIGLDRRAGPVAMRRGAVIDHGRPVVEDPVVRIDVSRRSATLAPLFPVFAGQLVVRPDSVGLHGRYAPPLGKLGLVIDRALLHRVARGTGEAFLARVAKHLRAAADDGVDGGAP